MPLTRALSNQIVDLLTEHLPTVQRRQTLVHSAISVPTLLSRITWEGSPFEFTVHLVKTLDQWGEIDGIPALEHLLKALVTGENNQTTIDRYIKQLRATDNIWPLETKGSPFPGLQAFQERHEPVFFGREPEIYRLSRTIREKPLVAVIGASGSGKSSLLRAGVIPRFRQDREAAWHILRMTPDASPIDRLHHVLNEEWQTDLPKAAALATDPAKIMPWCEKWLKDEHVLLLVDQFEETFTTTLPDLRAPFIQLLCKLLTLPHVRIVLTVRVDFYEHCVNNADLAERMTTFPLPVARPWALREMIARPAQAAGLIMADGLIDTILDDTGDSAGNLALLAYALDELYQIAEGKAGRIGYEDYEALGGVQGAIGKQAQTVFDALEMSDEEKAALLGRVFHKLVEVDERGTATRKRAAPTDFTEAEHILVDRLIQARLLVTNSDDIKAKVTFIEVAHEALFRSWERLSTWIADTREDLILLRRMQNAAYYWNSKGRPAHLLWPDEELKQVDEMRARLHPNLSDVEEAFLRPEAERLLEEFRTDDRQFRRLSIIERWGEIGKRAVGALVDAVTIGDADDLSNSLSVPIIDHIKTHQASAIPQLLGYIKSSSEVLPKRRSIVVLTKINNTIVVPTLIEALKDQNSSVRYMTAEALGKLGDRQAVPHLIDALKDQDYFVRRRAAAALGVLGDLQAVPHLIDALKDQNANVQSDTAEALGKLGDVQAVPALRNILNDSNKNTRESAAKSLIMLGDSQELTSLLLDLKNDFAVARYTAAKALSKLSDSRAISALIDATKDRDEQVVSSAVEALGNMNSLQAVPTLIYALKNRYTSVRRCAVQALAKLGDPQAISALIHALNDQDSDVRRNAASILGKFRDPRVVLPLIDTLNDQDSDVRRNAASILGKFRDPRVVLPLIDTLNDQDSDVRRNAANALGKLGATQAVPVLIEALKDDDPDVRQSVASALEAISTPDALAAVAKWREERA